MSYFYYTYSIGSENRSVHRLFDASIGPTYKLIALNFCLSQIVPISEFLVSMDYLGSKLHQPLPQSNCTDEDV